MLAAKNNLVLLALTLMYNHALGINGQSQDNDGYVSTSAERTVAIQFIRARPGGNGYLYEMAASPGFIQVSGTLGEFSPYPGEAEYAVMGGFTLDQVIGWTRFEGGIAIGGFVPNPD
ncbi:hypothetical protein ACET3X_006341 [Alternaria dauci]|uniref:Uncharacterized protein n=1 Tax=Alternaria dauci TaxID=48095 RepID=A0ABR3UI03_9PLEO